MMTEEKQLQSLRVAEVIDAYRVFPRIFLTCFFLGYCWLMLRSWDWYMSLDFEQLETAKIAALTAFPVTLLTGIGGMFTSMYKHYQGSGMDWSTRRKIVEEFKNKENLND